MPSTSKPATAKAGRGAIGFAALLGALLVIWFAAGRLRHPAAASAAPAGPAQAYTVLIENMKFSPAEVNVHPGDRVTFRNRDLFPHSATAKTRPGFDSGALKPGEEWTFVAQQTGTLAYACVFHPTMTGTIVVASP